MAISKQQSMRPAEIELIDASNQHESTLQAHAQSLETLDANLSTETTERESADTALGTRIDNEVAARTAADTQIRTDFADADTALGTRIDDEVQVRTDADTALGTRIDDEVQARTDADTALGTRIDGEVQARTDGDAALQGQIDALVAIGAEPNVIDSISVNGVAQTVTDKNVDITASSVVDGNAIAPSSMTATGNVSGRSVSDSVGSLADLRDSMSLRFGMQSASSLGLTSTANDNLGWYWNKFGKGLHAFWIDGNGKLTNQPHGWGNMLMFITSDIDMCQIYIDTRSKVNLRLSDSSTRTWNAWTALN